MPVTDHDRKLAEASVAHSRSFEPDAVESIKSPGRGSRLRPDFSRAQHRIRAREGDGRPVQRRSDLVPHLRVAEGGGERHVR